MKKRITALLLCLVMALSLIPTSAWAANADAEGTDDGISVQASNSTVVLHPSVNHTVTGVKVKAGDTISGYTVKSISGYDITVDLGKYNVNNGTFRLPYAKDIWYGVDNNKVDYITWAGSGSNKRSEGGSALLANGKNTAYYYFKGEPVLPTFTLNYNANGGTGAPASQTYKATSEYEKSHTFTISSQTPTREDYNFLGWSTNRNATAASYQPSGTILVTGTTTLYAVWEEKTPPTPDKPGGDEVKTLLSNIVDVYCTVEQENGADKRYGPYDLDDGTFTVGDVAGDATNGYTCTVTIDNVDNYTTKPTGHTTDDSKDAEMVKTITLTRSANATAWSISNNGRFKLYAKCEQTPPVDPPTKPTDNEVKTLLGNIVDVYCTVEQVNNADKLYGPYSLEDGTFTVSDVAGDATNGYTCTVTIDNVDNYTTKPTGHTTDGNKNADMVKIVTLTRSANANEWSISNNGRFKLYAKCDPTPTKPTDLTAVRGVRVNCVAKKQAPATHSGMDFCFLAGTYTVSDVARDANDAWYVTVTVTDPGKYVSSYDGMLGIMTGAAFMHDMYPANQQPTVKLVYDKQTQSWNAVDAGTKTVQYATINVICRPALPTIPELNQLGVNVNVSCATKDSKHTGKTYTLNANKDVVTGTITMNSQGKYECVLKLRDDAAKAYVTDYSGTTNADKKTHTLKDNGSVTLVWGDNGWELKDQSAKTLIITATCTTSTVPGGNNIGPAKNPYTKDEPKKVESGKTFDAGIALYVGLGILSLTGSAVAIRKREEY